MDLERQDLHLRRRIDERAPGPLEQASPRVSVVPLLVGERYAGDLSVLVTTGGRAKVRIERLTCLLDGRVSSRIIGRIREAAGGASHLRVDYLKVAGVDVRFDPWRREIRLDVREDSFPIPPSLMSYEHNGKPAQSALSRRRAGVQSQVKDDFSLASSAALAATPFGVLSAKTAACIANGIHAGYAGSIGWNWTVMGENPRYARLRFENGTASKSLDRGISGLPGRDNAAATSSGAPLSGPYRETLLRAAH